MMRRSMTTILAYEQAPRAVAGRGPTVALRSPACRQMKARARRQNEHAEHHQDHRGGHDAEGQQQPARQVDGDPARLALPLAFRWLMLTQHPGQARIRLFEPLLDRSELAVLVVAEHGDPPRLNGGAVPALPTSPIGTTPHRRTETPSRQSFLTGVQRILDRVVQG